MTGATGRSAFGNLWAWATAGRTASATARRRRAGSNRWSAKRIVPSKEVVDERSRAAGAPARAHFPVKAPQVGLRIDVEPGGKHVDTQTEGSRALEGHRQNALGAPRNPVEETRLGTPDADEVVAAVVTGPDRDVGGVGSQGVRRLGHVTHRQGRAVAVDRDRPAVSVREEGRDYRRQPFAEIVAALGNAP